MNTDPRPVITRNLLSQHTLQHEERHLYFDAVFPSAPYANGEHNPHGEGYTTGETATTLIPSAEYFVIQQLWPDYCFVSQELFEQNHNSTQLSLFA